jgi:hypothetical protein
LQVEKNAEIPPDISFLEIQANICKSNEAVSFWTMLSHTYSISDLIGTHTLQPHPHPTHTYTCGSAYLLWQICFALLNNPMPLKC